MTASWEYTECKNSGIKRCWWNREDQDTDKISYVFMDLLPDTWNCGLRMCRECRERFPCHRGLAIPICITIRAWRTCRDACRDHLLAVTFELGCGGKRCRNSRHMHNPQFTYLVRGPSRSGMIFLYIGCDIADYWYQEDERNGYKVYFDISFWDFVTDVGVLLT